MVVIDSDFKIIEISKNAVAIESKGQYSFEVESIDELRAATILEICKSNGAEVSSRSKKAELIDVLKKLIKQLEHEKMSDEMTTQKVEAIVEAGVKAEKTDEEMMIEIIQLGVKFKAAGKMFQDVMQEKGYRVTAKLRKEKALEILEGENFDPESYEDLVQMVERLVDEVPDTVTSQANSIIRSYAKDHDVILPKPPKGATGIRAKAFAWIVENPSATVEALRDFIATTKEGLEDERIEKYVRSYQPTLEVANKIAAAG